MWLDSYVLARKTVLPLAALGTVVLTTSLTGCGDGLVADGLFVYNVQGTFVDGQTDEPLAGATVGFEFLPHWVGQREPQSSDVADASGRVSVEYWEGVDTLGLLVGQQPLEWLYVRVEYEGRVASFELRPTAEQNREEQPAYFVVDLGTVAVDFD